MPLTFLSTGQLFCTVFHNLGLPVSWDLIQVKMGVFVLFFKYLFIYLAALGSLLQCAVSSLQCAGSLVAACGLLVAACGIPDQESNPGPLHRELRVLTAGPPGKSLKWGFCCCFIVVKNT